MWKPNRDPHIGASPPCVTCHRRWGGHLLVLGSPGICSPYYCRLLSFIFYLIAPGQRSFYPSRAHVAPIICCVMEASYWPQWHISVNMMMMMQSIMRGQTGSSALISIPLLPSLLVAGDNPPRARAQTRDIPTLPSPHPSASVPIHHK